MASVGHSEFKHTRFKEFDKMMAVNVNTHVKDHRGEVLVDSACLWASVPYTSQDVLPVGAVI